MWKHYGILVRISHAFFWYAVQVNSIAVQLHSSSSISGSNKGSSGSNGHTDSNTMEFVKIFKSSAIIGKIRYITCFGISVPNNLAFNVAHPYSVSMHTVYLRFDLFILIVPAVINGVFLGYLKKKITHTTVAWPYMCKSNFSFFGRQTLLLLIIILYCKR